MHLLKINSVNNINFNSIRNIGGSTKNAEQKIKSNILAHTTVLGSIVGAGVTYTNENNKTNDRIILREQAKRYNEKEEHFNPQQEFLNRIKDLSKKMQAKMAAGEKMTSEEVAECLKSKKLEARRLPDFSKTEIDYDFYNDLDNTDCTCIEMTDFKKEAAIIKNKQLKKIAETICRKGQLSKVLLNYIRDIDAGLDNITDKKILKHLRAELKRLADIDYDTEDYTKPEFGNGDYFFSLNNIAEIVDVYNTITGKYSRYKAADLVYNDVFIEKSELSAYMNYFRQHYDSKSNEDFIKILHNEGGPKHYIVKDFESKQRTEALAQLSNKKEMLDYIYEKYYVRKIENAKTKKLCREISVKYGTKVLLSNKTRDINKALTVIRDELEAWTKVSEGKAFLPRIIDLNCCDAVYNDSGAYTDIRRNIHYDGAKIYSPHIIRHELMHNNDGSIFAKYAANEEMAKLIRSIIRAKEVTIKGEKTEVLDWDNCKYREEFLKAGIDSEHIKYAYTNKNEFLAVAAEGDLSQYSPEFKEILIKIGMPEYVFNLPVDDGEVETNVDRVKDILKEHPNASYDELVNYIEDKKSQELSPRDKLLNAIFGKFNK